MVPLINNAGATLRWFIEDPRRRHGKPTGQGVLGRCRRIRVIGAGAPPSTWEAIAPGVSPPVNDAAHPGQMWTLNAAGELTETQGIWMTGPEARELATSHPSAG